MRERAKPYLSRFFEIVQVSKNQVGLTTLYLYVLQDFHLLLKSLSQRHQFMGVL